MNWKEIFKIQGVLLIILSVSMLGPLAFSVYYGAEDFKAFAYSIFICFSAGSILYLSLKTEHELRPREGFIVVSLGWITAGVFGALPFYFYGISDGNYVDCLFETMSGFTTTGASILTDIESLPDGLLFWRSLTQWLGGMGIILLVVALLPVLGLSSTQLYRAEVPGPTKDKISPKVKDTAKILWYIYLGMTVIQTLLLFLGGMSLFDSLCHTFTTLSTGGFSTMNKSVAAYDSPYIETVIIVFMYLSGINFMLLFFLIKGRFRDFFSNPEWKFYTLILLSAILLISFDIKKEFAGDSFGSSLRFASFQVVSITTTTGFITADYESWPYFSKLLLILLMFMGGCSGSTGGSIKQIRVLVLFKHAFIELKKLTYPRAFFSLKVADEVYGDKVLRTILAFFVFFMMFFAAVTLILTFRGYDIITSFSASIATLANIGPGLARVGAVENFAFFDNFSKLVLTFNMLVGRLEIYSVLILIYSVFNPKKLH
jgi:trk system potassium uptake protein